MSSKTEYQSKTESTTNEPTKGGPKKILSFSIEKDPKGGWTTTISMIPSHVVAMHKIKRTGPSDLLLAAAKIDDAICRVAQGLEPVDDRF